jgi:hypothetical protein
VAAKRLERERALVPATVESAPVSPEPALDGGYVSFPNGSLYHRPACVLATGKQGKPPTAAAARRLQPCPVCAPEPIAKRSGTARAAKRSPAARKRR